MHLPVVVTITTAVFTPKGWLHCILYVLFENAMGIVKLWAVIAGLPSSSLHPSPSLHHQIWLPAPLLACSRESRSLTWARALAVAFGKQKVMLRD